MSILLLEIGTEEIPARFLLDAMLSLSWDCMKTLGVPNDSISVYATPRRLALIVRGISEMQEDRTREVFGPPKKIAYNEDGSISKAGLKFAESVGLTPEKLIVKKKDKGEYVAAEVVEKGLPTKEVLPNVLKKIILSLSFPKSMRWGNGNLRFARPIRWIVALTDGEVIPFEIDGIRSGNITRGHRFLSPQPLPVKHPEDYEDMLFRNCVVVDQKKRKEIITAQMDKLASAVSGRVVSDSELLKTVTYLIEYPWAVLGRFQEEYLGLPGELLSTVMEDHQKYFPVKDTEGKLMNCFILISNTLPENDEAVRQGAERVIRARFEDARFYLEEDKRKRLYDRVEDLKRVVYHEQLGSLYDKTGRIRAIVKSLAERIFTPPDKELNMANAERAAILSKADLITGVVREFPELQGVMGSYYAEYDGENMFVSKAIREQYFYERKDFSNISPHGAILNIADKMDNIASFFFLGLKPTGSQDPFALRRQAIAVIEILIEKKYPVSIGTLLDIALSNLSHIPDKESLKKEILQFFEARFEFLFLSESGYFDPTYMSCRRYPRDVVESVLHIAAEIPLREVHKTIDALDGFKSHPEYNGFLLAIKRVRNILPERELPGVDTERFLAGEEKALYEKLKEIMPQVEGHIGKGQYPDAIGKLLELKDPIVSFFDRVLVMDKDERIRDNRLGLLLEVWKTALKVADFSKLKEAS